MAEVNITGVSENIEVSIDASIATEKHGSTQLLLEGKKVGISISDSADLRKLGLSQAHIQDASIEFARYLLIHGATLVYGGDLRQGGFTELFSELARLYSNKEMRNDFRFKNYFAWPIHLRLTRFNELDFKQNNVEIVKLPPPKELNIDAEQAVMPDTNENKVIWAKSLSYMRQELNANTDARIFIGGQTADFKGKYPGILEEAYYALRDDKPVYLIGGFGGASKEIINSLNSKSSEIINSSYPKRDSQYEEFYNYWNENEAEKISYSELANFFKAYGLKKLAEFNGLDEAENRILFSSVSLPEIIYYVLKGLKSINSV
jgi:hypothetical protein